VLGAAGMGKTRLALRFAIEQRDAGTWTGGVWLCDLHDARGAEDMLMTVSRTLGVPLGSASSAEELAEQLRRSLCARGPTVIVLDNFEQLDAPCDKLLERWIAPQVLLVVTSRRRLRAEGEHTLELGSLGLVDDEDPLAILGSDAVRLFVERARAVRPGYQPDAADAPWLARIVRQLDGMPLAIELAAARMNVLSAEQLGEQMANRFALLRQSGRADGQRALEAALDWSWILLGASERRTLARCSVFRGGWELNAAERVLGCGERRGALELLASLQDQSLVHVEWPSGGGVPRYRLYESVRAYAAGKLEEHDDIAERHAQHYVELAEIASRSALRGDEAALALLGREQQNVLAAFEHSLASACINPCAAARAAAAIASLEPIFERRGPMAYYLELVQRATAVLEGREPHALTAKLALCTGRALQLKGQWTDSLVFLQRAEGSADAVTATRASIAAALACVTQGAFDEAEGALARAEASMPDDQWLRGKLLWTRGFALYRQGKRSEARAALHGAVAHSRAAGAAREEAFALGWLGFVADGRAESAVPYLQRSTRMLADLDDARMYAWHVHYLAVFEVELGAHDAARASFERALAIQRRVGDRAGEAATLAHSALLPLCLGDPDAAVATLERSISLLDEQNDHLYRGEALALLGAAEALLGLGEQAEQHFGEAQALLTTVRYPDMEVLPFLRGQLALCAARAALARGDAHRAAELCKGLTELAADTSTLSYALTRLAQRFLRVELERVRSGASAPPASRMRLRPSALAGGSVRVAENGSWLSIGGGARLSLSRRPALRRILRALVERRRSDLGATLTVDALLTAGWPKQRFVGSSGIARVYTAVARLRRLGLGEALEHDSIGYRLSPTVTVERR
jgi:predicted ATPase